MQCAVCGAEAEDLASGDFDGLAARCKHCGEYAVVDAALNDFLRLDYEARVAALERAKQAAGGTRPTVTEALLS